MIDIKKKIFLIVVISYFSTNIHGAVTQNCLESDFQNFRVAARQIYPVTEKLNKKLISCVNFTSERLMWMSYYYSTLQDWKKLEKLLDGVDLNNTLISPRLRTFLLASSGKYEELYDKVKSKDPEWANDLEALLTLARALIRAKDEEEGRQFYREYLDQRPNDKIIWLEYYYSFLWFNEWDEAKSILDELRRKNILSEKEYQKMVKDWKIYQEKYGIQNETQSKMIPSFSNYSTSDGFDRLTYDLTYTSDWLNINVAAHKLDMLVDGTTRSKKATDVFVSSYNYHADNSEFILGAGLLMVTKDVFYGFAEYQFKLREKLGLRLGYNRTALAKYQSLPDNKLDLAREAFVVGGTNFTSWTYRFESRGVPGYGTHFRHAYNWKSKFRKFKKVKFNLDWQFLVFIENETHNKNSAVYFSPKWLLVFHPGIGIKSTFPETTFTGKALYGLGDLQLHSEEGKVGQKAQFYVYTIEANIIHIIDEGLDFEVVYNSNNTFSRIDSSQTYGSSFLKVGLIWDF